MHGRRQPKRAAHRKIGRRLREPNNKIAINNFRRLRQYGRHTCRTIVMLFLVVYLFLSAADKDKTGSSDTANVEVSFDFTLFNSICMGLHEIHSHSATSWHAQTHVVCALKHGTHTNVCWRP